MVQLKKNFKKELIEIKKFLAQKRKLSYLARELGVDVRTVQYALSVNEKSELTGRKIDIYNRAKSLKKEIEECLDID